MQRWPWCGVARKNRNCGEQHFLSCSKILCPMPIYYPPGGMQPPSHTHYSVHCPLTSAHSLRGFLQQLLGATTPLPAAISPSLALVCTRTGLLSFKTMQTCAPALVLLTFLANSFLYFKVISYNFYPLTHILSSFTWQAFEYFTDEYHIPLSCLGFIVFFPLPPIHRGY